MFTQETLESLSLGDHVESGRLFPGLSDEPIVWELIEVKKGTTTQYKFLLYWFGVVIDRVAVDVGKDGTVSENVA